MRVHGQGMCAPDLHSSTTLLATRLQDEAGEEQYHALGAVEGHEGEVSLRVRFKLTDAAQAGNLRGLQRWVGSRGARGCWQGLPPPRHRPHPACLPACLARPVVLLLALPAQPSHRPHPLLQPTACSSRLCSPQGQDDAALAGQAHQPVVRAQAQQHEHDHARVGRHPLHRAHAAARGAAHCKGGSGGGMWAVGRRPGMWGVGRLPGVVIQSGCPTAWVLMLRVLPAAQEPVRLRWHPHSSLPSCPPPHERLQPSQSLLAARGKLEVPPLMRAQMQKTYNESQVGSFLAAAVVLNALLHGGSTTQCACRLRSSGVTVAGRLPHQAAVCCTCRWRR